MKNKYYLCSIIAVTMLSMPHTSYAQTAGQNYIVTETMLDSTGTRSAKSVQYYDGLGRPNVLAANGINTKGTYLYTMTEYDNMGRESKVWLPAVGTTSPSIITDTDMAYKSNNTYPSDGYAFSELEYDGLGRLTFRSTPGKAWHNKGKGIKTDYIMNTANSVRKYTLDSSGNPSGTTSYYPAASLTGERVTDEDGHVIETYKDLLGNVVLERRKDGTANNDTYYVYDRGLLKVVIPPLYQTAPSSKTNLLYKYKYDGLGRCTQKTLPGNVIINYWYDMYGRVSFMQDGRMKSSRKFRFYLYDGLNRLAVQGLTTDTVGKSGKNYEAKVVFGSAKASVGNTGYYIEGAYTISSPSIEIANYYDGYDCLSNPAFSEGRSRFDLGTPPPTCVTTLQTAQIVTSTNGERLYRVMYYDERGRCTESRTTYPNKTMMKTATKYSFTDKPTSVLTTLINNGSTKYTACDSIQYDTGSDLPKKELLSMNGMAFYSVSDYTYDDLGRLKSRKVGDNSISETYSYDLHGWLNSHSASDSKIYYGPMFSESLNYTTGKGTPCYNGNISSVTYFSLDNSDGYGSYAGFKYEYDGLNRLVSSTYKTGSDLSGTPSVDFSETITYNENSAPITLKRWGQTHAGARLLDDLTYTYNGNQLRSIKDSGGSNYLSGNSDFNGVGTCTYSYDTNGALISDGGKGIYKIEYDYNGMPTYVKFTDGNDIEYFYTSDGVKLKTIHRTVVPGRAERDAHLTDATALCVDSTVYVGAFEFPENSFYDGRYYYPGGYVSLQDGNHMKFNTMISDHLGNTRVVLSQTNYDGQHQVEQRTNYYAFGGLLTDGSIGADVQTHKFIGKELDTMHGLNMYDFGARQLDPTTGLFTSMDPLCEKYYNISPYSYCAGNPVNYIDPTGEYIAWFDENMNEWIYDSQQNSFLDNQGNRYSDDNNQLLMLTKALSSLYNSGVEELKSIIDNKETGIQVQFSNDRNYESASGFMDYLDQNLTSGIAWNPNGQGVLNGSATISLGHELAHSYDRINHITDDLNNPNKNNIWNVPLCEKFAVHIENKVRAKYEILLREHYFTDGLGKGIGQRLAKQGISLFFDKDEKYAEKIKANNYVYNE